MELCPCGTVLLVLQFRLHEPGAGLGPGVLLAGAPQGQDAQGAHGPERGLCRGPRRAQRRRRRFRLHGRHRRHRLDQIHLAARSEAEGLLPAHPGAGGAVAQMDRALQRARAAARAPIAANSTTSASTSPRRTWSRRPAASTTPSTRRSWSGAVPLRGLAIGTLSRARLLQRSASSGSIAAADAVAAGRLRALPAARGDTGLMSNAAEARPADRGAPAGASASCCAPKGASRLMRSPRVSAPRRSPSAPICAALESAGALTRTHGGRAERRRTRISRSTSSSCSTTPKRSRIAEQAAVALIRDGETIILDSGTTTAEIARRMRTAGSQVDQRHHQRTQCRGAAHRRAVRAADHAGRHPAPRIQFALRARWPKPRSPICRRTGCTWARTALDPRDRRHDAASAGGQLNAKMIAHLPPGGRGGGFLQARCAATSR